MIKKIVPSSGDLLGKNMKLHEFNSNNLQVIEVECFDELPITEHESVNLFLDSDQFYLEYQKQLYPVEPKSTSINSVPTIKYLVQQNALWTIVQNKNKKMSLSGFVPDAQTSLDLDIAVDEVISQFLVDYKKISVNDIQLGLDWLTEEFLVHVNDTENFAFAAFYANQSARHIILIGKTHTLEINEIQGYWQVEKINQKRPNKNFRLVALHGEILFKDQSIAKKLDHLAHENALKEHTAQHGDYIETWKQYSDAQWEYAVERANKISYLRYSSYESEQKTGYWYIYVDDIEKLKDFDKNWEKLDRKKDEQIQLGLEIPDWLDNQLEVQETGLKLDKKSWRAEIIRIELAEKRILLKFSEKRDRRPPFDEQNKKGFLFLSIFSVLVQRMRQQEALTLINSRRNPMPNLHSLLQGIGIETTSSRSLRKLRWKSSKTKSLFKGGRPTIKQQEAIELGLNNSDLSIIIGPPGTGKTQVITALQQRIGEESESSIQRSILLTSYQHDAVDNVVDRSNVMGIAGLRIGGKTQADDEETNGVDPIAKWAMPIRENLKQEINNNDFIQHYRKLESSCLKLRLGNTEQKAESKLEIQTNLEYLGQAYKLYLSHDLRQWWQLFQQETSSVTATSIMFHLYPVICSLRTTLISFADDGNQRCRAVLATLKLLQQQNLNFKVLTIEEQDILQFYIELDIEKHENIDFETLKTLKNQLIDRCLPDYRPLKLQTVLSEEACQKIDQILREIKDKAKKSKTLGYLMVLDKYRYGLITTTGDIRDTLAHYTAVLAATCQQAAGNAMQNLKIIDKSNIIFENVIVDEAARATPLDLMIPMAMAKRRLILVGDHRQLPHMLDDKIEKELSQQQEWKTVQSEMLEQSLFQRLVESMQRLEKEKQQPKRVIMLDTQFRMHPILGEFISKNFYENHNLPPVKPGKPETDFIHAISNYGTSVAAFKHVAIEKQQRAGTSWHRLSEAKWIAQEVKRILDEKPELSIGVISFYSGQVKSIFDVMADPKFGLTTGDKISENYRVIEVGENIGDERLRIGTVDAFQGKEFDVVFVSLVRTLPDDFNVDELDDVSKDEKLTKAYGFLRVDNRLNVALSRQRSLLILVGDQNLIQHPATVDAVPALPEFLALCGGQHGQIF